MIARAGKARREFNRFVRFSVVGTIGAVVDFGSFNLLHSGLGVPYLLSGSISFAAAILSNYLWNRYWTYPDSRSKPVAQQFLQFALVNLVGLGIRIPVLALAEEPMINLATPLAEVARAWFPAVPILASLTPGILGRNLALMTAVLIVLFWNFAVNRIWTYSDVA